MKYLFLFRTSEAYISYTRTNIAASLTLTLSQGGGGQIVQALDNGSYYAFMHFIILCTVHIYVHSQRSLEHLWIYMYILWIFMDTLEKDYC